jgi:hydroxymethylpyrimidine pyrophosphatase-like HAD family hydrolase
VNERRLVLATDLDGTFAHGEERASRELVAALRADRATTLIYVTGRSVPSARELMARWTLPEPDVLIADVGTSVVSGPHDARMTIVEQAIAARWPGRPAIEAALARIPGLEPQLIDAPHRASFWISDNRALRGVRGGADFEARPPDDPSFSESAERVAHSVAARAAAALHKFDVDLLLSGNLYLDVLPSGVNKGWTLHQVLKALRLETGDCVVAGDSLNDRALFDIGARGIVVSNCEPLLRQALARRPDVYFANAAGAGGILEGLRFMQLLPLEPGSEHGQ